MWGLGNMKFREERAQVKQSALAEEWHTKVTSGKCSTRTLLVQQTQ